MLKRSFIASLIVAAGLAVPTAAFANVSQSTSSTQINSAREFESCRATGFFFGFGAGNCTQTETDGQFTNSSVSENCSVTVGRSCTQRESTFQDDFLTQIETATD